MLWPVVEMGRVGTQNFTPEKWGELSWHIDQSITQMVPPLAQGYLPNPSLLPATTCLLSTYIPMYTVHNYYLHFHWNYSLKPETRVFELPDPLPSLAPGSSNLSLKMAAISCTLRKWSFPLVLVRQLARLVAVAAGSCTYIGVLSHGISSG